MKLADTPSTPPVLGGVDLTNFLLTSLFLQGEPRHIHDGPCWCGETYIGDDDGALVVHRTLRENLLQAPFQRRRAA